MYSHMYNIHFFLKFRNQNGVVCAFYVSIWKCRYLAGGRKSTALLINHQIVFLNTDLLIVLIQLPNKDVMVEFYNVAVNVQL